MTTFRIEIRLRDQKKSANKLIDLGYQLGVTTLTGCSTARLFFVQGSLDEHLACHLAETILADTVIEDYSVFPIDAILPPQTADHSIEVTYLPGVTDTVAENLLATVHRLGWHQIDQVATGQCYLLEGPLTPNDLELLANKAFSNSVIQRVTIDSPIHPLYVTTAMDERLTEIIPLRQADDQTLLDISQARRLSLDLAEMRAIQQYYQVEARDPSDIELEMFAQTWSEHCVHKTFKAQITYTENGSQPETIRGLLNTYIRAATNQIDKGDWVRSAFVDNAGIIAFNADWDLAFKVETHNHPSAIEPFGGANTGVGGVIRDVLGVSARPIANTDVLCFGPQDLDPAQLPSGTLHPRRIEQGVVHGVEDYGNKMGIPTINGAVLYHKGYTANPLVFCGCLGLLPHQSHPTEVQPNDLIIVIGGRTGRDGLRGATFSSMEMNSDTGVVSGSAVQIGHPINEKQVLEVIMQARDAGLYHAITDCGAGGLSSAIGEMSSGLGATVQLQNVPLKYAGLRPWEIWLSEAQERMVLAVAPENWAALQAVCALHDVEAVCIGTFETTGRLILHYGATLVGDIDIHFLHDGIPTRQLQAEWNTPPVATVNQSPSLSPQASLLALLAHPNIRSKEAVIRRYDHEVQGGMTVKPLVNEKGHGDAAVFVPLATQQQTKGVAISNGICPTYGEIDPYAMAWAAVDESLRNLVAVGADPDQVAILDNFCWGNPNLPDRLGALVRTSKGCYDAALAYQTPFISGKDSLNNEYTDVDGTRHAIPGTLLISAVGLVPNIEHTVTADLKQVGSLIYLIGATRSEFGGSHYHAVNGLSGGIVPQPVPNALQHMRRLYQAITQGIVQSCHDCSEGGLAVAIAEMCIAGSLGATLQVENEAHLFSESLGRFVVEVRPADVARFENLLADTPYQKLGTVAADARLTIETYLDLSLADLEKAWRGDTPHTASIQSPSIAFVSKHSPTLHTQSPRVLILHAKGTNRDHEAALACQLAGGVSEIVHINQLFNGERSLLDYHMLVLPGGFSYGDDLGAGVVWALDLQTRLIETLTPFIESGRPVLGICNGFQALVKAGLLPGHNPRTVTLAHNESGQFECRWVYLKPNPHSQNLFTEGLEDLIYCPVAHGEGRIAAQDETTLHQLWDNGLVPLTYVDEHGDPAPYPYNPNGSALGIAALCNPAGNVMGLMPHPEDHIYYWQHPQWRRGQRGMLGIHIFENAIKNA
ncbi:MAG: phosphoribosylformylglycinamidine synthase subunit PurL [Chloroflexi bacterium]|nr:phosphoribosylformylglycinamidine synthase subunit PurL [Chloroflexota bacterium]